MFGFLLFLVSAFHPAAAQAPVEQEAAMEESSEASSVVVEEPQAPAAPAKPVKRAGKKRKAKQKTMKTRPAAPAVPVAAPAVQEKKSEAKPDPVKSSEPVVPATGITPSNP